MSSFSSLLYSTSELLTYAHAFEKELKHAQEGKKTSLAFVKNPIPNNQLITNTKIFQVMVVGATVFWKAIIKGENIERAEKELLPIFQTKEQFLEFITNRLDKDVSLLSINFAYPLNPILRESILDGELIRTTKEQLFEGLLHELIGKEVEAYVFQTKKRKIKVTVANDTVCLALSGLTVGPCNELVGGIVGSGMNFSLFLNENTVVNLESGNFNSFNMSESGKDIDARSTNPGSQCFEKEVSGTYLYMHFNYYLRKFSIPGAPLSSSKELSILSKKDDSEEAKLSKVILKRSASLVAVQMAGIYWFKNQQHLTFVMEGSVFWKGFLYQEELSSTLVSLGIPKNAISFIHIPNSNIVGALMLVKM